MILRPFAVATLLLAAVLPPLPAAAQGPAQSFVYGQKRFRHLCRPPLKLSLIHI